jgi:hypothetical protein
MHKLKIVVGLIMLLSLGNLFTCSEGVLPFEQPAPSIPLSKLLAAPDTIDLAGRKFFLHCNLYYNLMPTTDNKNLFIACAYIEASDSAAVPAHISSDAIYLIHESDIWKSHFDRPAPLSKEQKNQFAMVVGTYCDWEVGLIVDAVVRIVYQREVYLLRAPNQYIGAVY